MKLSRMGMVILSLVALAMVNISAAQNAPADYLNAHNSARAQVGVGPLTWDNRVAAYAQNYANKMSGTCALQRSGGPYGENLAWSSASSLTGTGAVNIWVSERQGYDYNSIACAVDQVCGHYTQVVWRNSVRLGCARVVCRTGGTFIICNYDPPGNKYGENPLSLCALNFRYGKDVDNIDYILV